MARTERACVICGTKFRPSQTRSTCCSSVCRLRLWRRENPASECLSRTCDECGDDFTTTRSKKRFCSAHCLWRSKSRVRYERRKAAGMCGMCGKERPELGLLTCADCRAKASTRQRERPVTPREAVRREIVCVVCCEIVTDARHGQKYCSPACRSKGRRVTVKAPTPAERQASRVREAERRSRRGNVYDSQWMSLRRRVLAEESTCHICGDEIDPTLKWPHPRSGTADHVVPLSKHGGRLDRANVHAAHFWCNTSKGARAAAG